MPVLHAAERAAALTRQLLALGRAAPDAAPLRGRGRRPGPARADAAAPARRLRSARGPRRPRTRSGAGGPVAGGAAAAQPRAERPRRDARRRPPDDRDAGRRGRGRNRAARAARPLRHARGLRRGRGDRRGDARAHLRAVLHHEAGGRGIGPRPRHVRRSWSRPAGTCASTASPASAPRSASTCPARRSARERVALAARRSGPGGPRDRARGRRLGAGARDHARAARGPRLPGAHRLVRRGGAAARARVGRRRSTSCSRTRRCRASGDGASPSSCRRCGRARACCWCRTPGGRPAEALLAGPAGARRPRRPRRAGRGVVASWFRLPRGMAKRAAHGPGRRGFLRRLGASVAATLAVPGAASAQARKAAPRRKPKAKAQPQGGAREAGRRASVARASARARARPRRARRLAAARARRAHRPRAGALDLAARRAHARQHLRPVSARDRARARRPSPRAAS